MRFWFSTPHEESIFGDTYDDNLELQIPIPPHFHWSTHTHIPPLMISTSTFASPVKMSKKQGVSEYSMAHILD